MGVIGAPATDTMTPVHTGTFYANFQASNRGGYIYVTMRQMATDGNFSNYSSSATSTVWTNAVWKGEKREGSGAGWVATRIGYLVTLTLALPNGTTNGYNFTVTNGFRPIQDVTFVGCNQWITPLAMGWASIYITGAGTWYSTNGATDGARNNGSITYLTGDS
jgi:hypothetical protein